MFETLKRQIVDYCEGAGIEVPVGFNRNRLYRYVAVDMSSSPPRLVAVTWRTLPEVVAFLRSLESPSQTRVFDFSHRRELTFNGEDNLVSGATF